MRLTLPARAEVESAVAVWRGMHHPLDQLLRQLPAETALRRFGLALWEGGQLKAAIHILLAAAALAPEEAAIWRDLANLLCADGRHDEAQAAIEMALAKDPAQPQSWVLLATILNGAHKFPDAERAFRIAIEQDPNSAEASFGLGILMFRQHRMDESIDCLRKARAAGAHNVGLYVCLGQALFLTGRFIEAAEAFDRAARLEPVDKEIIEKVALLQFIRIVIEDGSTEAAYAKYCDLVGTAAEDLHSLAYKVFHLLTAYGYRDGALRLAQSQLAAAPEDPVCRYLVAVASGDNASRAPQDYVVNYFNRFAATFDHQLQRVLHYRVPQELHALIAARRPAFARMLDLGCGTGLAARFLKAFEGHLTGVDLSPLMLEKARERGLYDTLVEAEATEFLAGKAAAFDLIFAADTLIYFGDLSELFERAAAALLPGGLFAFSLETGEGATYELRLSGRFAHGLAYVEGLGQSRFATESVTPTTLRTEAGRPILGALVIMRRL